MSTSVWPPIAPDELVRKEEESLETFASLKAGLEECDALLSPNKGPSTLVLSSLRSEALKGFATREGTRIIKGDINLRLISLPPPKGATGHRLSISSAPQAPTLVLAQLISVRNLINASLDIIDVSRWTGDSKNGGFILGQLRLLCENMSEAKQALKGSGSAVPNWWESPTDEQIFDPPLPTNLSFDLTIYEAALLLNVRVLDPSQGTPETGSSFGFRDRLAAAVGIAKPPIHDETGQVFHYKGQEVIVKEKLKVESQDPTLLSVMTKLSALEHSAAMSRKALETVMGQDD